VNAPATNPAVNGLHVKCARDLEVGDWFVHTGSYRVAVRVNTAPEKQSGAWTAVPVQAGWVSGRPTILRARLYLWDGTPYAVMRFDGTCSTGRWRCTPTRLCKAHQEELKAAQTIVRAGGVRASEGGFRATRLPVAT
jgi:hypothetical protein